jgi:hypothetical protein
MEGKNIYQRLHAAMETVSYVQKDPKKSGMQYTFASHDAVTAKVRPALLAAGIVTTVSVKSFSQDGNRTEATVVMRFVNVDNPSDFVEVEAFGYGIDPQDKGPGKAVSYACKYAMLKTLSLETGDDPERDQIQHAHKFAWIDEAAATAVALFQKGDEVGCFGEVYDIVMSNEKTEEKLYLWNVLKGFSAVRSSIKRQTENERKMEQLPVEA